MKNENLISRQDLINLRKWTSSIIKKFLKEPDLVKKFPHNITQFLYSKDKILEIEQSEEWKNYIAKSVKRKIGAQKAVKTKTENLIKEIESVSFNIEKLSLKELLANACNNYNIISSYKNSEFIANYKTEFNNYKKTNNLSSFAKRIMQNYLRHDGSNYEEALEILGNKIGKDLAYLYLKDNITNEIEKLYPYLKD